MLNKGIFILLLLIVLLPVKTFIKKQSNKQTKTQKKSQNKSRKENDRDQQKNPNISSAEAMIILLCSVFWLNTFKIPTLLISVQSAFKLQSRCLLQSLLIDANLSINFSDFRICPKIINDMQVPVNRISDTR